MLTLWGAHTARSDLMLNVDFVGVRTPLGAMVR